MKKKLIKLAIVSSVFAVGLGAVVINNANKTAIALSAETHNQHINNYDEYQYTGNYYNSIDSSLTDGLDGTLRTTLGTLVRPTKWYTYSGSSDGTLGKILQSADQDPNNSSNMILLYTRDSISKRSAGGTVSDWNREHVWPQDLSNNHWGTSEAGADLLHIRPTWSSTNSKRGSIVYGNTGKKTTLTYEGMAYAYTGGSYFEPLDSVKGDVARILMYVWTAYYDYYKDSRLKITNAIANYNTLLEWHTMDKPDVLEGNRNNFAESSRQGNRNPFVDHPEYAWKIFGEQCSSDVVADCQAAYPGDGNIKTLQRIAITGEATNKTYYAGESFDPTGLTVTAYYDDDTNRVINNLNCTWTPNPLTEGTTTVTCKYGQATATYSGIQVIKRVNPVGGNTFSVDFKEFDGDTDSGDRLDGASVIAGQIENNTLLKSASDTDNIFAGVYGLKFGTSSKTGSIKFTLNDEASVNIEKIEITTTAYRNDVCTFDVMLGSTAVGSGNPGDVYEEVLADVSASTLTITTDKRMYLNKIVITIKEEVPPTPGPGGNSSSSSSGSDSQSGEQPSTNPTGSSDAPGTSSDSGQPETPAKKSGCSGSIIATASLTSLTALIGLVFIFSKKRK